MTEKLAEELFIEDGEYNAPALRGAMENWLDRDWGLPGGKESRICGDDVDSIHGHAFKNFENWLNRRVDDDWFKGVKKEYGCDEPRVIFYEYMNSNEEFRGSIMSHVEGTDEWYERLGKDADWDGGDVERSEGSSGGDEQASFGESEFPQLHEIGVVTDTGAFKPSKLRGLVIAFSKDIDVIKGEERHLQIEWVQREFLHWSHDKFEDEWLRVAARDASSQHIFDAVKYTYNNKDDVSRLFHEKYEGGYDLDTGKDTTDDALEAFLSAEVDGYNEPDDEEETKRRKSRWEEFEERSDESKAVGSGSGEGSTSANPDNGSDSDGGDDDTEGDGVDGSDKWDQFEKKSEELEVPERDNEEEEDDSKQVRRDNGSSTGNDSNRSSDGSRDNDGVNSGTLGSFAEEHGTTDTVQSTARARKSKKSSSSSTSGLSRSVSHNGQPSDLKQPQVDRLDELERNNIYRGNVYEWASKLPSNSVDTMVTSPPYYALRDYDVEDAVAVAGDFTCLHDFEDHKCKHCGAWMGQLGREDNPAQFIDHIVDLMNRLKDVLKPTGSLWLNIGDTYSGKEIEGRVGASKKSRIMVPERVYTRLVEEGWRLRNYVIWVKKIWMPDDDLRGNGKPFASGSRLADQWEPMANFTPEADHYSDVDSNRLRPPSFDGDLGKAAQDSKFREDEDTRRGKTYNSLGTNPSDVWLINGDGRNVDHRAVFPEELPKRCIQVSTPDRVCENCGVPYEKEVHVEEDTVLSPGGDYATYEKQCQCDAGHEPGVVMDPFLGSGTTAIAAANSGFDWVGVELSDKYAEIARSEIPEGRQEGLDQWT